jgi:hypothetical protein
MKPPPIVPIPAARFLALRGRRVIIGVPGIGFRGDLRADDPVVQGSRTYVPVLTEQDYYRAETDHLEVFAPLIPIDRVWVETVGQGHDSPGNQSAPLDDPPITDPHSLVEASVGSIIGRRVVQRVADGFVRDLRATTPLHVDERGRATVKVCGEAEWYRWATAGTVPDTLNVNAQELWTE